MSEPFISEIRLFSYNWAPKGWAMCNGQRLTIADNATLFALLGTTYGGDGNTYFNLPDFRSRVPIGIGENLSIRYPPGIVGGQELVTLSLPELAEHTHAVRGSTSQGNKKLFTNAIFARAFDGTTRTDTEMYGGSTQLTALKSDSVSDNGNAGAHNNIQPSLTVNFCIALEGLYPPRN